MVIKKTWDDMKTKIADFSNKLDQLNSVVKLKKLYDGDQSPVGWFLADAREWSTVNNSAPQDVAEAVGFLQTEVEILQDTTKGRGRAIKARIDCTQEVATKQTEYDYAASASVAEKKRR